MKVKTTYTSDDGKVFATEKECLEWEKIYKKVDSAIQINDFNFDPDDYMEVLMYLDDQKIIKIL